MTAQRPKATAKGRRSPLTAAAPGHAFASERLLQQAIAGLLQRMPGISGIQILQGAQEYGKDVVFTTLGPMGEPLPCACVIKNTKITGKVGATGSARALFDQIEQSLDTPFLDGSGKSISVERAYVINPIQISQVALNSIRGKLKPHIGRVIFVTGPELFRLFQRYWPAFLADEASQPEEHLK